MSTYKVIQDIEAEDKLIGPLSLRQFIYAIIVVVMGFIAFKLALVTPYLAIPFLPPMALFGVLAAPVGVDQSSEIWLLAKIRFHLKPRRRIWDQSGIAELVTITVPKRIEHQLTDGLSQTEVKSRLRALANTIDSRGWAIKNVNVNMYAQPGYVGAGSASDRLVDTSSLPQEVPTFDVTATEDILDEHNNPTAQHLDQMITASAQAHRQQVVQQMQQTASTQTPTTAASQPNDYWFLNATAGQAPAVNKPGYTAFDHNPTVLPGQKADPSQVPAPATPTAAEEAFLEQHHKEAERANPMNSHLKTIAPLGEKKVASAPAPVAPRAPSPANQQLASNDDLNISTIARQANQNNKPDDGEVVISLR